MFRFERPDGSGTPSLIDDARRVTFRVVSGLVMSNARVAVLGWNGRQIPLEFESSGRTDPSSGERYELYRFTIFGFVAPMWQAKVGGVRAYAFRDAREQSEARLLAAEAVLVHNFRYVDGDWKVETARIVEDGRELRASDFGYRTSGDIAGGAERAPRTWRRLTYLLGHRT